MASKMLIDASHPQETRVVVVKGNKVEEFDFESDHKKQIRGNIYLAKVTRVEPSLQAAFVEYGGNRHGFLPFSEIHPDYYQIPLADREALLREYERELADEEGDDPSPASAEPADDADSDAEGGSETKTRRRSRRGGRSRRKKADVEASTDEDGDIADGTDAPTEGVEDGAEGDEVDGDDAPDEIAAVVETDSVSEDAPEDSSEDDPEPDAKPRRSTRRRKAPVTKAVDADADEPATGSDTDPAEPAVESAAEGGAAEATAEAEKPKRRRSTRRKAPAKSEEAGPDAESASDATSAPDAADAQELSLNEAEGGVAEGGAEAGSADDVIAEAEKPKRRSRGTRRRSRSADKAGADDADDTPTRTRAKSAKGDDGSGAPDDDGDDDADDDVEAAGGDDGLEDTARPARAPRKHYKIQEVIKRRQILLVQVTKEERGNKGAALTTYLSLAGRYSVLMPNTARGGGISRKIAQASDRKRLKDIAKGLEVPRGMGVILRTAAAARTKPEINRDFDYLMRLWDSVRELTLSSSAPALVYEEGDLIKRSIRDLYRKEIDEIVVAGDRGYRDAKDFMRMLMPSQARVVKRWTQPTPMLAAHGVEAELDRMLQPEVKLKSGGYIIINQTEALVAIDVNSGRATREHSIESTALQTNLEAAEEIGRQLRLRDLAGLIVIDFIDMDERRNNRSVEKRLKDCLKDDRARIQLGRISSFGLLEMSRQRMRSSVIEATMQPCESCGGTGYVRSASSVGIQILRAVDEQMRKNANHAVVVRTAPDLIAHLLNVHRAEIADIEGRHGLPVRVQADGSVSQRGFAIDRGEYVDPSEQSRQLVRQDYTALDDEDEDEEDETDAPDAAAAEASGSQDDEDGRKRRRGRRGGRNRKGDEDAGRAAADASPEEGSDAESRSDEGADAGDENGERPARRRSRRRKADEGEAAGGSPDGADQDTVEARTQPVADSEPDDRSGEGRESEPKRRSTRRRKAPVAEAGAVAPGAAEPDPAEAAIAEAPKRRSRRRTSRVAESEANGAATEILDGEAPEAERAAAEPGRPEPADAAPPVAPSDEAHESVDEAAMAEADDGEVKEGGGRTKKGWWNRGFF